MKKSIILLLSVIILLGCCSTLEAQNTTSSHDIEITVEEVANLSITGSDSVIISYADWSGDSLTNEWKAFNNSGSELTWLSIVTQNKINEISVKATDIPSGLKLRVSLNDTSGPSTKLSDVIINDQASDFVTDIKSESKTSQLIYEVGVENIENVRASSNSIVNIIYTIQDEISS